jgi:hypothetical protein
MFHATLASTEETTWASRGARRRDGSANTFAIDHSITGGAFDGFCGSDDLWLGFCGSGDLLLRGLDAFGTLENLTRWTSWWAGRSLSGNAHTGIANLAIAKSAGDLFRNSDALGTSADKAWATLWRTGRSHTRNANTHPIDSAIAFGAYCNSWGLGLR